MMMVLLTVRVQLPSSVGTKESEAYLWTMPGTTIELTWYTREREEEEAQGQA